MRIKRFCYFAMAVAVAGLFASCNKDNGGEETSFRATIEMPCDNGSRTHIDPPQDWNSGTTNVLWTTEDLIKVSNANGTTLNFQIASGENTNTGIFNAVGESTEFFQPDYAAIYPVTNAEGVDNSISGTTATFNIPQTQTYLANSFAEKSVPMVAYSSSQSFSFKNVFGGICFPLVGDGLTVTRVVLTSKTDEHLYGVFTADCNSNTPVPTYVSGGGNSIVVDCSATPVTLSSTPTNFFIMLPPATLAGGFSVEAFNGTSRIYYASTTNNPNITRSVITKVDSNLQVVVASLTMTTISPTFITKNSALGLGAVDNMPAECGFIYALADNVSTPNTEMVLGSTNANISSIEATPATRFDAELTGLNEDAVYYIRAYAINAEGTVTYGDAIPFATRYDYYGENNPNQGRTRKTFSMADNKQVYFSMGNLQYIGSATPAYWKFADNQFDYIGTSTNQTSTSPSIDRDLFAWGTSGYSDNGATEYWPWSLSYYPNMYYVYGGEYGGSLNNLNSGNGKGDWGYNAISNGGNQENLGWRTPQGANYLDNTAEWLYMINPLQNPYATNPPDLYSDDYRTCAYRFVCATLKVQGTSTDEVDNNFNGVPACGRNIPGLVVFPDDFTMPTFIPAFTFLNTPRPFSQNKLTEAQWSILEQAGAVFLPNAGTIHHSSTTNTFNGVGTSGFYYSATIDNDPATFWKNSYPNVFYFGIDSGVLAICKSEPRHRNRSVRLVIDAN